MLGEFLELSGIYGWKLGLNELLEFFNGRCLLVDKDGAFIRGISESTC